MHIPIAQRKQVIFNGDCNELQLDRDKITTRELLQTIVKGELAFNILTFFIRTNCKLLQWLI
jgi:hypothetical protein